MIGLGNAVGGRHTPNRAPYDAGHPPTPTADAGHDELVEDAPAPTPPARGAGAVSLYRDEGVVLRTLRLGEADRIVTMITKGHGKVRAVAKGVRRTKSKFGARLEPLSHVMLLCWQGRELDIVNQAEVTDTFRTVRQDLARVAKAYTVLEVTDQLSQERHANPRLFDMVVGALRALEARDAPLLVPAFCLKVLALEGSAPVLEECVSCGEREGLVAFDLVEGGVLCRSCRRGRAHLALRPWSWCAASWAVGSPRPWRSRTVRWPVRSPIWPPRPWRSISTGACAACARAPWPRGRRCPPPFGVYVHVPFCASRCDYCAFATWTDRDPLMAAYAEACATELRRATRDEGLPPATSLYVGGGTPSRLPAELLGEILGAAVLAPGAEVTAECNPEDASADRFARWHAAGVTRVSFGVQSMVPHVLDSLGRRHGTTQVARRGGARRRGRLRVAERRPHPGCGRRDRRRCGRHPRRRARPRAPPRARERLRLDRGTGDAPGPGPGAPSRRRRRGPPLRAGGRGVVEGGVPVVRGVELGHAGPRVPAQHLVLGPGRLPRHRVRGALAPGPAPVVEHPDARALRGGGAGRAPHDRGRRGPHRRAVGLRGPRAGAAHVGGSARIGGARRPRSRRPARAARRRGRCSPCAGGCSPTR